MPKIERNRETNIKGGLSGQTRQYRAAPKVESYFHENNAISLTERHVSISGFQKPLMSHKNGELTLACLNCAVFFYCRRIIQDDAISSPPSDEKGALWCWAPVELSHHGWVLIIVNSLIKW